MPCGALIVALTEQSLRAQVIPSRTPDCAVNTNERHRGLYRRMEEILRITIGPSNVWQVAADMNLEEGPSSQFAFPDSIEGRLLRLTTDELLRLKFGEGVVVGVRGRRYKFIQLEKDGTFRLRKDRS